MGPVLTDRPPGVLGSSTSSVDDVRTRSWGAVAPDCRLFTLIVVDVAVVSARLTGPGPVTS